MDTENFNYFFSVTGNGYGDAKLVWLNLELMVEE